MSISADGYVAGPGQCEDEPLVSDMMAAAILQSHASAARIVYKL
jgi:hypothetical protein